MWFKRVTCFLLAVLVPGASVYGVDYRLKSSVQQIREVGGQPASAGTDIIRTFQNKRVLCEEYLVKKGDRIWNILEERVHGSVAQIIHWSKVLQT
ncbi:MAG: hypothetical protein V3W52_14580, partial [Syntrophobacteria bacterium]